jgi:hypothetical protein
MQTKARKGDQHVYGVVLLGTIISCFIAWYNNYPLVYPDTGSYMASGWCNKVFYDRTIFYGLFIYETSCQNSPFLVVFVQGLLVCYLLYMTLGMFFTAREKKYIFLGAVTFLTLFTGFSYTVSILIPDIFSSITLLCLINLLVNRQTGRVHLFAIAAIYVFSICTQFSSIPILTLLYVPTFAFLVWSKVTKRNPVVTFRRFFISLALTLSTLFIIPATHYYYDGDYKISGSNHVFVMNHLLETGVLEDYLQETCGVKNYRICQYKDSLGWDFIWNENSALQKTGGWEANRKEYKEIIKDVIGQKKYFWMLFRKGIEYSFKQFFTFQTSISPKMAEGSGPYGEVKWHFEDTKREYLSSLQNNNKLDLRFVNGCELIVIFLSIVFLLTIGVSPALTRSLTPATRWTVFLVLLYSMCSSVMCSNLSTVHPRFQNRIVWLFPLCAGIIIIQYIRSQPDIEENKSGEAI